MEITWKRTWSMKWKLGFIIEAFEFQGCKFDGVEGSKSRLGSLQQDLHGISTTTITILTTLTTICTITTITILVALNPKPP